MRRSASWQSAPDDRILEIAAEDEDGIVKVGNLADHDYIHVGQSQVSRRCKKLAEHGLLRKIGDGVYVITDRGEAYLKGEYDVQNEAFIKKSGQESPDVEAETGTNGT
jgi:Mn-dependent DtxR family transcriptional regulator